MSEKCEWNENKHNGKECPIHKSDEEKASELLGVNLNKINKNPFNNNVKDMPESDESRIINLTPKQYIDFCASILDVNSDELINNRRNNIDKNSIDELKSIIKSGKQLDMPWLKLNYGDGYYPYFQEGLHRMIAVADIYGDNYKVPIMLGTDSEERYDGIENMNNKSFSEFRKNIANRYNNEQKKKENERKNQEKRDVANFFDMKIEDVTDDDIKQYNDFVNDLFGFKIRN